ncbi:MAG: hypothetical protein HKP57_10825, partial [Halobacteria archaeon]|nr:hypothetical protein [Halobacteria archaeon]
MMKSEHVGLSQLTRQSRHSNRIQQAAMSAMIAFFAFIALPASADWSLNNAQSHLSFVSIKKGDIAEVHR